MKFEFLRITDLEPQGWMKKQLRIQSEGLHGNLDKVWKDVKESKWVGGECEGWERFPYFLDGYIPLAYLTKDAEKIEKIKCYIDCIIKGQTEDGLLKPISMDYDEAVKIDRWSLFLILKVLTMYEECSNDERIVDVVDKGLKYLDRTLNNNTLRNWAATRWFECYIPILWLMKKKPQDYLIRLADKLRVQGLEYKYVRGLWTEARKEWTYHTHLVNISMALKYDAVYSELMNTPYANGAEEMVEVLSKYHGTAYGHFSGDECLAGTSAIQGAELCSIVEAMYSYEWLIAVTGKASWGDRLEQLAFNGLPATITEDMWAHQYDQQVNQISCKAFENSIFGTNGVESNMFGLEPHFGCCTSNFGQGFPKFVASSVMGDKNGFAIISPIPIKACKIINDKKVTLTIDGEYPFRNDITLWSDGDCVISFRTAQGCEYAVSKEYKTDEKGWLKFNLKNGEKVNIHIQRTPHFEPRPDGRFCVKYGNLLFALPIKYKTEAFEYVRDGVERKKPYCDYAFTPIERWGYAFANDNLKVVECEYDNAFSRTNPPIKIVATLAPIDWKEEEGYEGVASHQAFGDRIGENIEKELIPYGNTYLRITEMKFMI